MKLDYERDPAAIYRQSFATIAAEAPLDDLPEEIRPLAVRLIHACGMVDVAADLRFSDGAVAAGRAAFSPNAHRADQAARPTAPPGSPRPPPRAGASPLPAAGGRPSNGTSKVASPHRPIFCDSEMVARGIIARALPDGATPVCTLNDLTVPDLARRLGTTRSAAAVELWKERLDGAVVAIGNAPTALFHLLEGILNGGPKPALILGFPVGFVGAAESKQALVDLGHGVPYVTLLGRRGGSAMAAAAVNALTLGLTGDGT